MVILVTGLVGFAAAAVVRVAQPPVVVPPSEPPLGRGARGVALPSAGDFPVFVGGRKLLGAYIPGRGSAVAVLDQVRCARVAGVPPAPAGQDVFGLRVGVAIDLPTPVDSANLSFELTTAEGNRSDAVTVGGPGELQPGPALNVLDVYFHLPNGEHPKELIARGRGGERRLPACPVPAPGIGGGSES